MRHGKGLLLDFEPDATLQALTNRWSDRISYVAGEVGERLGLSAVLVRPDGVVAWVSDTAPDEEAVTQAMTRWFGD